VLQNQTKDDSYINIT